MFELSKSIQAPKCDFNYRENELLYDFSFSDLVSEMYGRGMYIMDLGMLNVQTDICIAYSDKSCLCFIEIHAYHYVSCNKRTTSQTCHQRYNHK